MKKLAAQLILPIFLVLTGSTVWATPDTGTLFAARLLSSNGEMSALAAYRGKPLVVNFWARWCPPCRAEIPELDAFARQQQGKITVLGIGLEDDPAAVRQFMQQFPMSYPVLLAGNQGDRLMRDLGNQQAALPYTVFIDAKGRIVGRKIGRLRAHDLNDAAGKLLPP